jgi:hypothetical protein
VLYCSDRCRANKTSALPPQGVQHT